MEGQVSTVHPLAAWAAHVWSSDRRKQARLQYSFTAPLVTEQLGPCLHQETELARLEARCEKEPQEYVSPLGTRAIISSCGRAVTFMFYFLDTLALL